MILIFFAKLKRTLICNKYIVLNVENVEYFYTLKIYWFFHLVQQ